MITLQNTAFNNTKFMETIHKVNDCEALPAKVSYKLYRFAKEMQERNQEYEAVRKKLLDKYGEADEEKGTYEVKGDAVNAFQKDFEELLDVKFEVNIDKFEFPEGLALSPSEMLVMEDIFDYSSLE